MKNYCESEIIAIRYMQCPLKFHYFNINALCVISFDNLRHNIPYLSFISYLSLLHDAISNNIIYILPMKNFCEACEEVHACYKYFRGGHVSYKCIMSTISVINALMIFSSLSRHKNRGPVWCKLRK